MNQIQYGQKIFLKFEGLTKAGVFHFSSTKQGWGSDGKSRFTGDDLSVYEPFRKELAQALHVNPQQFVFPRQVHGDRVEIVNEPMASADIPDTDALITNMPGICICVQTADCVPILLFDPKQKVVAAIHAGWRGAVNKIVEKTIQRMQQHFGSEPKNILAGIGPSISSDVYEVSEDVIHLIRQNFSNHDQLLTTSSNTNKLLLNLWEANKTILEDVGLCENKIEVLGCCTYTDSYACYSARRDGAETGRMVTGIMLT